MTFGEKLKLLRQRSGLSQANLADKLWVSRAAVAKWENGIGMPDIHNLKAIADYFICDLAILIDDGKDLTDPPPQAPAPNPDTYCGKHCNECNLRESLSCLGCKDGPGNIHHGDCSVAKCCRNHCKSHCVNCTNFEKCSMIRAVFSLPEERQKKMIAQEKRKQRLKKQARFFAPRLWVLFLCGVLTQILGCSNMTWFDQFPVFRLVCNILMLVCVSIPGILLLTMAPESKWFKPAGICQLIMALIAGLLLVLTGKINTDGLFITLVCWVGIYHEIQGYGEILESYHPDLSDSWKYLWKIYKIILCVNLACIFIGWLLQALAVVIILLAGLVMLVARVIQYVFLYKTARFFKNNKL